MPIGTFHLLLKRLMAGFAEHPGEAWGGPILGLGHIDRLKPDMAGANRTVRRGAAAASLVFIIGIGSDDGPISVHCLFHYVRFLSTLWSQIDVLAMRVFRREILDQGEPAIYAL